MTFVFQKLGRRGRNRLRNDMIVSGRDLPNWRCLATSAAGVLFLVSCSSDRTAEQRCLGKADLNKRIMIPAGDFVMGEDPRYPEEGPPRNVHVQAFELDIHEVTNGQFRDFISKTGYRTTAERKPPPLKGAPPEMLEPGSATFTVPQQPGDSWWTWTPGARWTQPDGPGSTVIGKDDDPVVQVSFEDALAYAKWAGGTLPTEEQWEYAARAGAPASPEPIDETGQQQANSYQGAFPARDLGTDGFTGRAPIGCFNPNRFGLHDMIGNVWEWTRSVSDDDNRSNVIKGGSYLCAANYCARYRPAARQFQELDLGTNHIGFRLAYANSEAIR
jgi:formylglycine-generating enzyme